jgi:YVTN family beta-propeller protein
VGFYLRVRRGGRRGAPVYFAFQYTGESSIKVFPQATLGNPSPAGYDVRRIAGAYVGNEYSSTVSVIDTRYNTVVDTVNGVAVAPEGVAIKHPAFQAVPCRYHPI